MNSSMKGAATAVAAAGALLFASALEPMPDVRSHGEETKVVELIASITSNAPGHRAVRWALAHRGIPYQWGGCLHGVPSCGSPNPHSRLDCSGYTSAAWWFGTGLSLPRTSREQYQATKGHTVTRVSSHSSALRPGDLLFWGASALTIHHVALYAGEGLMLSEPRQGQASHLSRVYDGSDFYAATRPTVVPKPVKRVVPKPVKRVVPKPVKRVVPKPVKRVVPKPVKRVVPKPVKPLVVEPNASAASSCHGTRVDSMPMKAGSRSAGRAELWYSGASGGTNCVIVYDNLAGRNTIGAYIDRRNSGGWDKKEVDAFFYDAGPVSLTNMSHTCVSWGGNMIVGSTYYSAFRFSVHCG